MLKALLVEDDIDLASTLIDYLALEDIECDFAADGMVGLNLAQSQDYHVMILDLNLPGLQGLSVCERLRSQGIATPILMLTAKDTLEDKLKGFDKGADDYLIKPFDMEELIARIKALSKRRSGQVTKLQVADLTFDLTLGEVTRGEGRLKLSPIASQLLEILMRASPSCVTREKLIEGVWGEEQPDSNSLKVHIYNLRKQINAHGPALLHTVAGQGFVLREEN